MRSTGRVGGIGSVSLLDQTQTSLLVDAQVSGRVRPVVILVLKLQRSRTKTKGGGELQLQLPAMPAPLRQTRMDAGGARH